MGNSPTTIGLKVDNGKNGAIMAGSILYGRIYLSNEQVTNARSIRLGVIGTEEAVVHHTTTKENSSRGGHGSSNETEDHYERHTGTFFDIDHTIKEFPNREIPRGQFEFPFALQLPASLPSSMKAENNQSHCGIRYEIVAEVFRKPNSLLHKNIHAKESLTVVAVPNKRSPFNHDSSLHLPVEIIPISSCNCCCFASCTKSGTMALEAKFDKTNLFMNAPSPLVTSESRAERQPVAFRTNDESRNIGIQFRCENKSSQKVASVEACLKETIEWSARGHTSAIDTVLATSTMDGSLFPELNEPSRGQEHRCNIEDRDCLLEKQSWRTIDPPLGVKAARANDTYQGRAIRVRHVLSLEIVTQGCCATNPDASTLVQIRRNPLAFGAEGSEAHSDPLFSSATPSHPTASLLDPFEDELFETKPAATAPVPQATAPPSACNDSRAEYANMPNSASTVPMVEAQLVLPEDWNAQTEDLVTIPIAKATVLDTSCAASGGGPSK